MYTPKVYHNLFCQEKNSFINGFHSRKMFVQTKWGNLFNLISDNFLSEKPWWNPWWRNKMLNCVAIGINFEINFIIVGLKIKPPSYSRDCSRISRNFVTYMHKHSHTKCFKVPCSALVWKVHLLIIRHERYFATQRS